MKTFATLLLVLIMTTVAHAQTTRYVVKLKNKGGSTFTFNNPLTYLSQRAVDRRTRYAIAIDSTDLPVTPTYLAGIAAVPNVTVLNTSKWLNAVTIQVSNQSAIATINTLPFVQSVTGLAARTETGMYERHKFEPAEEMIPVIPTAQRTQDIMADYFNYGTNSLKEIQIHHGEFLHNIGLRGQQMQIAVLDGGFFNYTSLKAFDSININGQVLGTWDFVARNASVAEDNAHGMQCLSAIAANIPGEFIGKAPKASFYLFRTEDVSSEYPIEEYNWVSAAERADSAGVDIISSSLGYYYFDNPAYNYAKTDLNGRTTVIVNGADLAAKKGLMVFNAAGNEGNSTWKTIVSPADGDSVVAVGAVRSDSVVGSFSSYGPSADGRVKPDLASIGVSALLQGANNTLFFSNGTSFACPNLAGMGTCLWQGFPEFNNMKIITAMRASGNTFTTPNDRIGYGIPDMKKAFGLLLTDYATSTASISNCTVTLNWSSKDVGSMQYEIERKLPGQANFNKIGTVTTQPGTLLANHSYQYSNVLLNAPAGQIAYRIKQIIDTAASSYAFVYIDTSSVNTSGNCADANALVAARIIPNPVVTSTATLELYTPDAINNVVVTVFNNNGQLIKKIIAAKGPGLATIDIPVDKFSRGKYYVRVYNQEKELASTSFIHL